MLKGKRVVILGGTAGIGLAVAEQVVGQGGSVVVASSSQARVDEAKKRLGNADGHTVDLRSVASIKGFFEKVGAFDHLVYSAGEELLMGPLASLDLDAARRFFDVRYWGALAAIQAATPHLARSGSVVMTGGAAGRKPHPGFAIGASICGAMESLTRVLAVELAPIRVNIVIPGFVETELWSNVPNDARTKMFADAAAALPVGRVGQPADIAPAYLAFMNGGYTTGQSVVVDGGGLLV